MSLEKLLIVFGAVCVACVSSIWPVKFTTAEQSHIKAFQEYFDIASVEVNRTTIYSHRKNVVCMLNLAAHSRHGKGKYDIQKHFDGDLCTHLVYRSISLDNETFDLTIKHKNMPIEYFKTMALLKSKYPDLKIILSVGVNEYGNVPFSRMTATKKTREKFIQNAVDTIQYLGFDGLDLDWKLPEAANKHLFMALARGLKEKFIKSELMLTTTISGRLELTKRVYDLAEISSMFDLVLVMAFDYHGPSDGVSGHNAPLYVSHISQGSVWETLHDLLFKAQVDPQVLILGVSFHGRPFRLSSRNGPLSGLNSTVVGVFSSPLTSQSDFWGYNEVCSLLKSEKDNKNKWDVFWDRSNAVPFATNGSHWMSFDNPDSIFAKVWLASHYNLKGIMAWTIDTDDFNGGCSTLNYPLLRTVNYALQMEIPDDRESHWTSLCTLYSSSGKSKSLSEMKPKIISTFQNMTIPNQATIKVNCSALGNPKPQIRWYKSKEVVVTTEVQVFSFPAISPSRHPSHTKKPIVRPADLNCGPHSPIAVSEEIQLTLDESRAGKYFCNANNLFGTDKKPFSLSLEMESATTDVPWAWIVGGFIVFVNMCLIVCYLIRRSNKKQDSLTKQELKMFFQGKSTKRPQTENLFQDDGQTATFDIPYNTSYEILQKDYEIDENIILGNGEFGIVFLGRVKGLPVAVKCIKNSAHKQYLLALLSELKILIYLEKHQNIVSLVGASTVNLSKGMLHMFVEYCALGNLQNYLRSRCRGHLISLIKEDQWDNNLSPVDMDDNVVTTKDLLRWSYQIAKALEYLYFKKVIHGDLASRNVLIFQKDIVKVTDFGISRKLYDYSNYVKRNQEPLPWRWMAIECLRDLTFSHQSDVWSLGITLWEIFSLGETPYSGISWTTDFVDRLTDGLRIHKPKYATTSLYSFLENCWKENPQDRPKPVDLPNYFYGLLKESFSEDYTKIENDR